MSLLRITTLACFALALGACQSLFQPNYNSPLEAQRDASEQIKPGYATPDCPLVNVDTVHFPDEPNLDSLIQNTLLQMARNTPGATPLPASLKAYEQQFLQQAPNSTNSYLQAKVREQHDGLVIIELSSYLENGNEHGTPGRAFINYSRPLHKALTLQDMLLPGQEEAFWLTAQQAHKEWMINNKVAQDPAFVHAWTFQKTPNVALTYGGVILKYGVTTIAPYDMGHIELKMSYLQLNGILKPELFPRRG
ncbi:MULTISPECIES: DUF3298 domain-containing protein [unclassified Pseudomonas]|uniref:DUF3298 domain-containing protein n=1 Tax=unclassified Pseudomonas TaxID=196821 RepID=UPI002B222AA9|nr:MULTISPECIES: DUF3298 domain-containing protein [unclassified Pseudomonas]MEA9976245.1 DUF3298 domain-containing protein [Pseudomonas sp. RTS4]MEB0197846.1 DUF3298 domain-containing protein [Pseudomonas sp. 5S4]MEB0244405.1 DUF3298 domain-containing protein [Pseudomonas sp. 10S5]